MALLYHPESGCYWYGELTEADANNCVEDVTGVPQHEVQAAEQINPIDAATGKATVFMTKIEIEDDVPPVAQGQKKAARRARKPKANPNPSGAQQLIKALQFVGMAQKATGTNYQTHCLINRQWCVAFDGVLTIGTKIEEDVTACPKTADLLAALQKCGQTVAISQLNEFVLSIRSEKFKASINCIKFEDMPLSFPDPPIAAISNELRAGFEACAWLAQEGAQDAFCACLLLQANSVVATNRAVLLEYWHGIDLPPGLLIPKAAAVALSKIGKNLSRFGYSDTSATFYFDDESFLKTQLFKDRYPQYQKIYEQRQGDVWPLPADFFAGVEAVADFSDSKFVFLRGDKIQSHEHEEQGATYDIKGIPQRMSFNHEYLRALAPHFKNVVFTQKAAYFQNEKVRGALMGGSHK